MLKVFLVFVLGIICTGCASSKVKAAPAPIAQKFSQISAPKTYGECSMMPNGYLVCPKAIR